MLITIPSAIGFQAAKLARGIKDAGDAASTANHSSLSVGRGQGIADSLAEFYPPHGEPVLRPLTILTIPVSQKLPSGPPE